MGSRTYRLGLDVFKIAKTAFAAPFVPGSASFDPSDHALLTQYCITERWTGDLSTGLFRLGERAARMHGLDQRECGLLNLVRCYDPLDHCRVLELFEQAARTSIFEMTSRVAPDRSFGKAIYYAPHAVTVPASGPWDESLATCTDVWRRPDFADIPHAGDAIAPGHPVCTIFAEAATEDKCVAKLKARAAELDGVFGWTPASVDA